MYQNKRVALVIPAYNEEVLISSTLANVPSVIDKIYVVDDCSKDRTREVVLECGRKDARVELIPHSTNQGPGGGIITGYNKAYNDGYDLFVVVGGDFQMPLDQVANLLDPLVSGQADYTKGNRFMLREGLWEHIPKSMPKTRLIGNMIITILTKMASGYYSVADVVDGYTALTRQAYERIDWESAWKGYGYPMDFLIRFNARKLRVKDVPRRAIYLPGQRQSQIKGFRYALSVSPMLVKGFFWRLWHKYVLADFHPVVLFFFFGFVLTTAGFLFGLYLLYSQIAGFGVSGPRAVLCALCLMIGFQSLLFAMLFDMEQSKT